jgi:hypothetical protein
MVVLGRIIPTITESSAGVLVASYTFKISDYPDLIDVGGSIKLNTPAQWKLNPDHADFNDLSMKAPHGRFPIAVTRVAESGVDAFKSVSTYCSHGQGYQVRYTLDDELGELVFKCDHLGSTFYPDGTHIPNPLTPDAGDLRKFPTTHNEDAGTVTINGVIDTPLDVEALDPIPGTAFLDQNYPNPFNPATIIRYGLPQGSHVKLTIYTLVGSQIDTIVDEWQEPGIHSINFSAHDIPSGIYFYRLQTESGTLTRRMTVRK